MRTRDAIADEEFALVLALGSGNGSCPTAPLSAERQGWKGDFLAVDYGVMPLPIERAIRRWQVGALARRIWEGLPYAQRWWMYGETEAEMRRNRRRDP